MQTPMRRPTTKAIAATPLERIPTDFVAEAERLISSGAAVLGPRLKRPLATSALRRQGVDASLLVAGAARPGITVDPREDHFIRQLLAQVLWEEQLGASDASQTYTNPPRLEMRPPQESNQADLIRAHEVRHKQAHAYQMWTEKERAVSAKRNIREQNLLVTSNERTLKHHQEEIKTAVFKECRQQHYDEKRCAFYSQDHERAKKNAQKGVRLRRDHETERVAAAAARVSAIRYNQEINVEDDKETIVVRTEKSCNAQMGAGERRQRALSARSSGRPSMRISREMAQLQTARFERLQAEKRLAWYDNLENNRSAAAGGVPPSLKDSP